MRPRTSIVNAASAASSFASPRSGASAVRRRIDAPAQTSERGLVRTKPSTSTRPPAIASIGSSSGNASATSSASGRRRLRLYRYLKPLTPRILPGDQPVELAADVFGRNLDVPARPIVAEEHEPCLLVAAERGPRALAVDPYRLRGQRFLHDVRVPLGQPKRGQQPERDRLPVRDGLVAPGRLERVRERMPEVEDRALPPVVRV